MNDAARLNPDWWRVCIIAEKDTIFQCDTCGRLQAVSLRGVCPRHGCPGTLREVVVERLQPNHYRLLYEAHLPGRLSVEEHTAQLSNEKAREFQRDFRNGNIHVLSCSTTFELGVDLGDLDTIFLRNVPPEAFNYAQRVGRAGRRSDYPGFALTYCRRAPHDLYHFAKPERMISGRIQPPVLSIVNKKIISRHITATALSVFFRNFPDRFRNVGSLFSDLANPSALRDFQAFLYKRRADLEAGLRAIVPANMNTEVGLDNGSWVAMITGDESRLCGAEAEISSDYQNVVSLEQSAKDGRNYRDAEWARRRTDTITKEDTLSFLSRKAVIPKYGFPVDVVELDTHRVPLNTESAEAFNIGLGAASRSETISPVAKAIIWLPPASLSEMVAL